MAEIDPTIALSYRPPNLATMPNLQVQTPLEGLARVVSLRNLMQEGQLKGLQLDQLRQQIAEQKLWSQMLGGMYGNPPGTTTDATGAPIAAPVTAPPPISTAPPVAAGPAPAGPIAGVPQGAFWMPPTTAPQPPQPQPLQQQPTAPAVAPVPQPTTVSASDLMTGAGIPGMWPAGMPSPQQILQKLPITGPAIVQQLTTRQKDLLDVYTKEQTAVKGRTEDMVRLALGSQDNPSFQQNVVDMARNGYITSDQARQYSALGFDDPKTQAWLNSVRMQAVSADKQQEMKLALAKDVREEKLFNEQYPQAVEARKQAAYTTASQTIGDLTDKAELPGWMANQDPEVLVRYGKYLHSDLPLDQIKRIVQEGAGAGPKAAEAAATTRAQYAAGMEPYEPVINDVMTGRRKLLDLPQDIQQKIGPELTRRGYGLTQPAGAGAGAPGAGGAPVAGGFGKLPSDPETERLYGYDRFLTVLDDTNAILNKDENKARMGPFVGQRATFDPVWSNDIKILRDKLLIQQAQLRKAAVDGQMRGVTPEMVDKLFPTILTNPEEAAGQMNAWKDLITKERDAYRQNLIDSGKIPQGTASPAQATPLPAAAPGPAPSPAPAAEPPKPSPTGPAAAKVPADVQDFLKTRPWGRYKLNDGRVFYKTKEGKIVPFQ